MNKIHKAAKTYLDVGLSVIPLRPNSKMPAIAWKPYQERLPDVGELHEWFGDTEDHNIGIVTGQVSGGLLVLDFDDRSMYWQWSKAHPDLAKTKKVVTPSGGRHLYYRLKNGKGLTTQPFSLDGKHVGEIRFNGGMVVAPPSMLGDSKAWRWVTGKKTPILTIPSFEVLGLELKSSTSPPKAEGKTRTTPRGRVALERAVGRLAVAPEGERNTTLNKVAFVLGQQIWLNELDRGEAEDRLAIVAGRIGLGEREIQATIGSGIESGLAAAAEKTPEPKRGPCTHRELMTTEFAPISWIVQDLMPIGLTILAGKPKLGKSIMGLQMAQAVASGADFLGFKTLQASTLMICLEDSPRRVKGRLLRQSSPEDLPIEYEWEWPPLDEEGIDLLRTRLEAGGRFGPYGLVVIDTLASAKGRKTKEKAAEDMAALTYPLQRMAQEFGTALLVIFHHRKGAVDDPIWDIRGSGATPGAADTAIGLYPLKEGGCKLLTASRDAPELELKIELDAIDTLSWQIVGDLRELAREEAEDEIIAFLEGEGEATIREIAEGLGKTRTPVYYAVKRLVGKGTLHELDPDKGGTGRPAKRYGLSTPSIQ